MPSQIPDPLSNKYAAQKQSFIVALAVPDVSQIDPFQLERATYGADVVELRVDHLSPNGLIPTVAPTTEFTISQVRLLRDITKLPTLYTIRTVSQGGRFPDNDTENARKLMLAAIELGIEYIDVEVTWPDKLVSEIANNKMDAKLVASFHSWTGKLPWTPDALKEHYERALQFGDVVKLSILNTKDTDNYEQFLFIRHHQETSKVPILAVGMGQQGQLSRVLSPISIVTHPRLPVPTAPGQISIKNINTVQQLIGKIQPKKFFIFGNTISHSLSPIIHNAAFEELGLPHHYSIHQTPHIDDTVKEILQSPDFGGASVTYPHKLKIQSLVDSISGIATTIGAVNTVVVKQSPGDPNKRVLVGDNTDWIGIRTCIERGGIKAHPRDNAALVIGAGGAARAAIFALQHLGYRHIVLVNRTKERAILTASRYPGLEFSIYRSVEDVQNEFDCIIACVPADDITESDIPHKIFSKRGVIVEMAYRPKVTSLMKVGQRLDSWSVFSGVDVLKGQAYGQFELWTGYRAPLLAISEALAKHESKE